MNAANIGSILDLITKAISIGGELLPVALKAYAALKAEAGMSDDQLIAEARKLNDADAIKLAALIAETQP